MTTPTEHSQLIINQHHQDTHLNSHDESNNSHKNYPTTTAAEAIVHFLLLPSQIYIVLLLEFLNTFRSYGLRMILFNYITNEYNVSDSEAGKLLGMKSLIDIGAGLIGCILVDFWGVRRLSVVALSIASVARALLAFGRRKEMLHVALLLCSPLGDALLSIGLYRVALKKLTTPMTRPLAFAVSYAIQNFAGVCVALMVDWMRSGRDIRVDVKEVGLTGVFTPVRQFVVSEMHSKLHCISFDFINLNMEQNKLMCK
jgi:hypothetical protein